MLAALCAPLVFGQANEQVNPAEVPTFAVSGSSARQVLPSAVTSTLLDTRSGLITHPGAGAGGADVTSSVFSGICRDIETGADATNRPIMAITASGLSITLPAGTYWLDWQLYCRAEDDADG